MLVSLTLDCICVCLCCSLDFLITMVFGLTSHVCLLMFLYFIQGLPYGIQTHFLPVFLRTHGTDLTEISLFRLLQAPWLFKVVWAPLIDSYSTRRQWLLFSISALVLSSTLSGIFSPENLHPLAVIALLLCNVFASMQDVSVDALALSILSGDELAAGNVAQIVGYKLGAAFAGGILALLVSVFGWTGMCFIMAAIYAEAAMLVYVSPVLRNSDTNNCERDDSSNHHHQCSGDCHKPVRCHHQIHCHLSNGCSASDGVNNQNLLLHHRHCQRTHCSHEHTKESTKQNHSLMQIGKLMQQIYVQPGTLWLMVFLFIYKLGEQGALSMMPMFLLDQKVEPTELTFWTGVVGQVVSICGSLAGGWFVTAFSQMPVQFTLQQVCLLRLLPIGIQLLLIVIWNAELLGSTVLLYSAMMSMMLLTFLSGVVTTATFTLMMRFTQSVSAEMRATHYTSLATVELIGKLLFTASCGWLANVAGYRLVFLLFIILSALVLRWIQKCPQELGSIADAVAEDTSSSSLNEND